MSDSEYSSDEAPEEVTFSASKAESTLKERTRKQAEAERRRQDKDKRRDRDRRLKEQQAASQGKQRKLLSELLQESDDSDEDIEAGALPDSQELARALAAAKAKKRFEEAEKHTDGFRIQLAKPAAIGKRKRLPPAGSVAVQRRDQFLTRASVPRK